MSGPERPTDAAERERALDPECSFIVQAPAGSGKTGLLIQRLLRLLATIEQPEEVLAITFTRKAAAEMRNRLLRELQQAHEEPALRGLNPHEQLSHDLARQVLHRDARREWDLLSQPNRLQIRTIDSLCSDLARRLPVLSGLGGALDITDEPDALYRRAAARALAALETPGDPLQEHVVRVLDRYDNQHDRLAELLTGMLASREQWLGPVLALRTPSGFDRDQLEDALRLLVDSQLAEAAEHTPPGLFESLDGILRFALENDPKDREVLQDLLGDSGYGHFSLEPGSRHLAGWQGLLRRLLTAGGKTWRKTVNRNDGFPAPSSATGETAARYAEMKQRFIEVVDGLRDNEALRTRYAAVLLLPEPAYDNDAWAVLESLLHLLLRAASEWALVAAEAGRVDYTEVSRRAIQALGNEDAPSDLALKLDGRLSHLLVDEFQDTSSSQVTLLRRLTEGWTPGDGRSLFLVGDPMQSIYRFRKAEVSLFIQAWEGRIFDQLELRPLRLGVNFRSSRPVVDWVNATFPRVMPDRNNPLLSAVRYADATPRPGAPEAGAVSVDVVPEREPAQEALAVVEAISEAGADESIAVLVRSRNHATDVLAALDQRKGEDPRFRYQAIDFFRLAETPLIRDLVALTLALLQPADSLAWLSVLRAPFCGLSLRDLEQLTQAPEHGLLATALAQALSTGEDAETMQISANGMQRVMRVGPILVDALSQRGLRATRALVESSWLRLGGPACLRGEAELADANTYFALLDSLDEEGASIDREALDLRLQRLYARPDHEADGRLKVMTIFAAKGLQFDRVIVPGLGRAPASDSGKLVHWFELATADRIVLSPMRNARERARASKESDLIRYIADTEKQRQQFENGRLLYVAATRAIQHLHLLGSLMLRADGGAAPRAGSLLAKLWPAIADDDELSATDEDYEADTDAAQPDATPIPQSFRRLAPDWTLPPPPSAIDAPTPELPEVRDAVEFSWAGEGARLSGVLVHRLLQQVGTLGLERWQAQGGLVPCLAWCRGTLAARGISEAQSAEILAEVGQAVQHCLASEQGRWVLGQHDQAESELQLTAMLDGRPSNVILDRTFVDDGTRWIIDYKTSTHAGGDLEGFLASEMKRYAPQLQRYRRALGEADGLPVKTALYYPLLDRLCEVD